MCVNLEPCPFCGNASCEVIHDDPSGDSWSLYGCTRCGVWFEDAAEWNKRHWPQSMTLEDAVKVLNEHGYDGHRDWSCEGRCVFNGDSDKELVFDDDGVAKLDMWIDDFTAIAVAEKFARLKGGA